MDIEGAAAGRIRQLAADIRATAAGSDLPAGSGRGLVVVAGGARIFTNAYVLLHVLRHALNCRLPIEFWCFGREEVSAAMLAVLAPLDIRVIDATPLIAATGAPIHDGWQLKAFALAHSGFAEVLMLDADQVPIADPAPCFDWPEYQASGAVFWPDIIDLRRDNAVWALLGLPPRRQVSLESAQLLVDRRRHRPALAAALRLNAAAEDLYRLVYGDKDTYLLGWELLGAAFAMVPHLPFADDCMLVQRDFAGNALFQHRTNGKFEYGGEPRRIAGFVHEAACRAALAELEANWSGSVFTAPDRSNAARQLEAELIAAGPLVLEAGDHPLTTLELQPHAEIGAGRAPDRRHWWIETDSGGTRLVLTGGLHRSYILEQRPDHIWAGQRCREPALPVSLMPLQRGLPIDAAAAAPGLLDELLQAAGLWHGAADIARLEAAVALLARVIPGIPARLRALAAAEPDAEAARHLRTLAASLSGGPQPHKVNRSLDVISGYVRAGRDE